MPLPGLTSGGQWDLPKRLNMAAQCLAHPSDKLAVIDLTEGARRDVSYGDLDRMSNRIARFLQTRVAKGDRVGVLLSQSPWCLASHLAIWKIGAVSVPLFKLFEYRALEVRIKDAGCALVLTDDDGKAMLRGLADGCCVADLAEDDAPIAVAETTPNTGAIIIYTSGTTGTPKGALHGHRVLTGHLPGVALSHNHLGQEGDVLWTPADWAWIGGLFDVALVGLVLGVPTVAARLEKFTAEAAREICELAQVRNVFFPPTALRVLKASGVSIDGLRSVASGGEPLGAEMLAWGERALGLKINEFYGQTECNMVASSCADQDIQQAGCIGKPVSGFEIAILDENGSPTFQEGDIAVKRGAASEMLRYWNRPEATAEKYRRDWLLTGDRGIWENGYLRFVGRDDDVITSSGYRIGPSEIEDCLLTHPAVATVGVVGKPDPMRTEIVKAYVVTTPASDISESALQDWVKDRLARYSYPREIEFVEALPMTVTGKVIRKELRARAAAEGAK